MAHRILAVDDDPDLLEMIEIVLRGQGWSVVTAADGPSAVQTCRDQHPDLVLLDVMLPGFDGVEVARRIRRESDVPVVMLTARTDTTDVVAGLAAGADDYVSKPFSPQELVARIEARLRRLPGDIASVLRLGALTIDTAAHQVTKNGEIVRLTPLEFDLLAALARQPGVVVSRDQLLEEVWGYHYKADTRLVNVHVQRLRAKIEDDPENPEYVLTVRGVGYTAGER
ncbi:MULTISPECIES: MtrAB system response regulator MtrA [unclassified Pseudoclavibacter]|uniref:MtrAB system response regulator MtrA n=1 Tax=unclassified Pseudoclavibacter TaxID=2615177 RepID=UPI001300F816|nr:MULTISPECIES: MtrAB system response regulator MtrA [unclassified Pseudoclavibacter]KAB1647562.1 response regulator [Pseudoclavibacter sp. CFCC 14310]KAB1663195.1 response regulator [Pseudoclavibacter sp. CFCC 13611]